MQCVVCIETGFMLYQMLIFEQPTPHSSVYMLREQLETVKMITIYNMKYPWTPICTVAGF